MLRIFISSKTIASASAYPVSFPSNNVLTEYRLRHFMSDDTTTTVPSRQTPDTTEEAVNLAARERMAAKLVAFEGTVKKGVA